MKKSTLHHHPYWLEQLDAAPLLSERPPLNIDVLIVGAGYTGLSAAINTARGGRSTVVVDAEDPGFGCSTRNGGQVSTSVKPSLEKLSIKFGEQKARAIRREGVNALEWIGDFIGKEGLNCDFRRVGRFHAAHTPQHYDLLVKDAKKMQTSEGIESFVVTRENQRSQLGTDAYFGGVVFPKHCSIHPAKYHREMLRLALAADAEVVGHCRVTAIKKSSTGFLVNTTKGNVQARDVIIATNGYTSDLVPWLQRRVIPIGSYIITTEELPESKIEELFPGDRIASDTCKVVYYYRATPDRKRVLFGGRVSASETDLNTSAKRLYNDMCRIFPDLKDIKISHSWSGKVAYSFDVSIAK